MPLPGERWICAHITGYSRSDAEAICCRNGLDPVSGEVVDEEAFTAAWQLWAERWEEKVREREAKKARLQGGLGDGRHWLEQAKGAGVSSKALAQDFGNATATFKRPNLARRR